MDDAISSEPEFVGTTGASTAVAGRAVPAPLATVVAVRGLGRLFAWAVLLLLFFWFKHIFTLVLMGFLAALCLSASLRPLLRWMPGPRGIKGFFIGLLPLCICAGLIFAAVWLLVAPIQRELQSWPQIEQRLDGWLAQMNEQMWLEPGRPMTVHELLRETGSRFANSGSFRGIGGALTDTVVGLVFVFIGTIYMLTEPSDQSVRAVMALLPARRQEQTRRALAALEPRLRYWFIGATVTAVIIGCTSLLGFWLIGVPFFIPLAILAGISEYVPTLGPAFAFLVALIIASTQGKDEVLWLAGLYALVHVLESYVLIPFIYREAVRIPPVVTLFTVVLWGGIFGIGGLILAIPIDLVLWTMAEAFIPGATEPLALD
ncbi:MAG TPA: AI-2E family transporter [Tepidisphaeraceae bacterium]|nr:AI-2E family transporter [Tepidisphaeraceae bacterium]